MDTTAVLRLAERFKVVKRMEMNQLAEESADFQLMSAAEVPAFIQGTTRADEWWHQVMNLKTVMHDCRNDSAALQNQYGVTLNNVFDTQAAHCAIQQQETGKPVYKVKNVSLNTLCNTYGGVLNPKREQLKKIYRKDPKYWSRRPLSDDMMLYAAYNVIALVPTVYERLRGFVYFY
ncbi:piRNA biogenesis protein EXD1 [Nymphon striatum]|nr:piRNA biogenesis protein EXD1 [Nymphon striatum]